MTKLKIFIAPLIIILVGLLIALLIISLPQITKKNDFKVLSSQEVGERVLRYFNFYIPKDNGKATLIEAKEESGVYKFKLNVAEEEFEAFTTKDGKFLFFGFTELTQISK